MLRFVVRRLVIMVPLLLFISVVTFIVIQLPPGDYLTTFYISNLRDSGLELDEAQVQSLVAQFGFDRPLHEQYFRWITNILRGNLGWSFQWNSSVNDVLTVMIMNMHA